MVRQSTATEGASRGVSIPRDHHNKAGEFIIDIHILVAFVASPSPAPTYRFGQISKYMQLGGKKIHLAFHWIGLISYFTMSPG